MAKEEMSLRDLRTLGNVIASRIKKIASAPDFVRDLGPDNVSELIELADELRGVHSERGMNKVMSQIYAWSERHCVWVDWGRTS
jgi:hypothetical protein